MNQKERVLEVVLTERGKDLLSKNQLNFSYFCFSDDGIDYSGSLDWVNTPYQNFNSSRIQSSTTGSNGGGVTAITASLSSSPQSGSTMIAVIGLQTAGRTVSQITQTNATWSKVTSSADPSANGENVEIWYAPNIGTSAGTTVAVRASGLCQIISIVGEYSGIDKLDTSSSYGFGNSNTASGTSGPVFFNTQNEMLIGGLSSVVATSQTAQNGFSQVGFTGSGLMSTGFYQKTFLGSGSAELSVGLSPVGVFAGALASFVVKNSASFKESLDDFVHTTTFPFEPSKVYDKTIKNFLFTMPLQSEVVPQFQPSITGSVSLYRNYSIDKIENIIAGVATKSELEKYLSQDNVLDYVVTVEEIPVVEQFREKKYVTDQFISGAR